MTLVTSTVCLITLAATSVGILTRAEAHQAESGWTYPPACCKAHDIGGDCEAIPAQDIRPGPHGFSIFLHLGDHHLATKPHLFFIPYGVMATRFLPAMAGITSAFIPRKTT